MQNFCYLKPFFFKKQKWNLQNKYSNSLRPIDVQLTGLSCVCIWKLEWTSTCKNKMPSLPSEREQGVPSLQSTPTTTSHLIWEAAQFPFYRWENSERKQPAPGSGGSIRWVVPDKGPPSCPDWLPSSERPNMLVDPWKKQGQTLRTACSPIWVHK